MKQLKRLFAWILAFALLVQASPLAYAEGGSGVVISSQSPSAKHPAPHVKLGAARLGVPAETEDTDTGIPPAEIPAADDAVESTAASALLPEEENVQDSSVLTEDEAKEIGDSQELSD